MFPCEFCGVEIKLKPNLYRHKQRFHPDELGLPTYRCSLCTFSCRSLTEMETHFNSHPDQLCNLCSYCHFAFGSVDELNQHVLSSHGLPLWGRGTRWSLPPPTQTALNGSLQTCEFDGEGVSYDLLEFMLLYKERILDLLQNLGFEKPRKVQFSALLQLIKPLTGSGEEEEEQVIDIHANSNTYPVYGDGLAPEIFFEIVDKMIAALFTYASQGSGWVLKKIKNYCSR